MAGNAKRSERIEEVLVWLTTRDLGGRLIRNNDLDEQQLRRLIVDGFCGHRGE